MYNVHVHVSLHVLMNSYILNLSYFIYIFILFLCSNVSREYKYSNIADILGITNARTYTYNISILI